MLDKALKFIKGIKTFRQLFLLALGGLIAIVMYAIWENRTELVNRFSDTKFISAEAAKDDLNKLFNFVLQTPEVSTVILSSMDLSTNKRSIVTWKSKDMEISTEIDRIKRENPIQSIFSETDPEVNLVIAQVINNKIACVSYNKFYKFTSPIASSKIKAICVISVPPIFGKNTGILTTMLTKEPTQEQAQQLALVLNEVSSSIVRRDILIKLQSAPSSSRDLGDSIGR